MSGYERKTLTLRMRMIRMEGESMADQRDLVHLNRLKCFNDAVFAIVSTILILPIRKIPENSSKDLETELDKRWKQLVVYFISFLVICSVWESHVHRFKILAHVDDVLVWLNLTSLMFTSFLPFACALEGKYPTKYLPLMLICADMLLVELLEVAMIFYSFHHDYLLIDELKDLSKEQQKERRNYMLAKKLLNPILYILAGSLSLVNSLTSWVVISIVIITPCIHRLIGFIFRKCKFVRVAGADFDLMFGNYIDTERVECFSDGVFSIVSTLLVLDITTENLPSENCVEQFGIDRAVLNMWPKFLIYAANFIVIALLWFIHHSLFHCIKKMNQFMLVCNNVSLAFVGFFPFIVAILNKFADKPKTPDDSTKLAVQCGSVVIFMASMSQAVVFVAALWKGPSHLEPKVNPAVSKTSHYYLTLKLTILPVISLAAYSIAITASALIIYIAFHAGAFVTPFLFLALKFCWGHREVGVLRHDVAMDPDLETWVPPPYRSRLRLQKNFIGDTTLSQSLAC